ncbi:MAG: hypothetical protein L6Q55_05710 [Azonexus sp.]|nr:hypothetical protein [Azonexus sp.]
MPVFTVDRENRHFFTLEKRFYPLLQNDWGMRQGNRVLSLPAKGFRQASTCSPVMLLRTRKA